MSKSKRYWELEEPKTVEVGKNVFKIFREAGKIQCYTKVEKAPRGLSKGVTIDLELFTLEELEEFKEMIDQEVEFRASITV